MANTDRPRGFTPAGEVRRVTVYEAGAAIYPGDAVKLSNDGQVDPAAAGEALLGVAVSYASGAGQQILVADHPDQLFSGQVAADEVDAQTDIGNVADILATAGNSTYKLSRMEIDGSTLAAGSSAQVQLLGVERSIGNSLGAQVDVVFRINEHQLAQGSNGV